MKNRGKVDFKAHIVNLLERKNEINLQDVAEATGLSKDSDADRKAINRILNSLVEQGLLEKRGNTRGRVYIQAIQKLSEIDLQSDDSFKGIELSKNSKKLLKYISGPLQSRKPVGYNQDFLRSYKPNETFYLDKTQRLELIKIGCVENQILPAGTYARNILNRLLIELSWNSSRLEGNTYSILETKRLIELGESAVGKDATETQMILNHKGAIEYIIESAGEKHISSREVCSIHALLSENLLGDPGASGRIRQSAVGVNGTTYIPLDNPHVLKECFDLFIKKLNQIKDPFEQSFFSIAHLSYMQAFEDVNKRTARLVANISLIKENLKPLSFADVDQDVYVKALLGIYEKNDIDLLRDLYMWAYQRSSDKYSALQQSMGEPNLLKMKYRNVIHEIIQKVIIDRIGGQQLVGVIQKLLEVKEVPKTDLQELFKQIETEIMSLHDGNIARFKVRPSEFEEWKKMF